MGSIDKTETSKQADTIILQGLPKKKNVATEMLKTFIFSASTLAVALLSVRTVESAWNKKNRFNPLNSKEIAIFTIIPTVAAAYDGWKTVRENKKAESFVKRLKQEKAAKAAALTSPSTPSH